LRLIGPKLSLTNYGKFFPNRRRWLAACVIHLTYAAA
jgi:hypothetical protein